MPHQGYVRKVHDLFQAELKMLDSGAVLKIDQTELETVIPAVKKRVRVVNGTGRGQVRLTN